MSHRNRCQLQKMPGLYNLPTEKYHRRLQEARQDKNAEEYQERTKEYETEDVNKDREDVENIYSLCSNF